jgi:hypothetical protein
MGKLAVALLVAAALCCAVFWPVGGRSFWQRAEERGLQRAAARLAARGLRSAWDFVASHGSPAPARRAEPPHPPQRRALRHPELARASKENAAPRLPEGGAPAQPAGPDRIVAQPAGRDRVVAQQAGPDRIVAQPPRETLHQSDRAALDKLLDAR